ncbi:MAG: CPBP family intramembrane glutamic endopeptidase [Saprospiraceae bacterium]
MFFKEATSGDNNPIFYLMTIVAVIFAYFLGSLPLVGLQLFMVKKNSNIGKEEVDQFFETMDFSILGVHSNIGLIFMILTFIFAFLAFMLCVKYLHKRPFLNIITPKSTINWKKIFFGFGLWFLISLIMEGGSILLNPDHYYMNFKPLSLIVLVLICLVFLPFQTSMEEFFLRGYIMPGIGLVTKNKWIPWVLSSVIFGIIHGSNPEVEKFGFWTMQLYYIGAGLFLGAITIMDDSLELALGVHAATNFFGAAIFSFDGSVLQTDSLVKASQINPLMMSLTFFIGAVVFIYICSKKYNWKGWSSIMEDIDTSKDTNKILINNSI